MARTSTRPMVTLMIGVAGAGVLSLGLKRDAACTIRGVGVGGAGLF